METLRKVAEGFGAVFLGELIGYISENLSSKIWQSRTELAVTEVASNSFFDYTLDAMVNITFIILGTSLVEKGMPSLTEDLHSFTLFVLGLTFSQTRLPTDLQAIMKKLTTPAVIPAPSTSAVSVN